MRTKPKRIPEGETYQSLWESKYKPLILSYYEVPIEIVAEALGISVTKVQEQLRSGEYNYGVARKCKGDTYRYEFMPMRVAAYIEGRL